MFIDWTCLENTSFKVCICLRSLKSRQPTQQNSHAFLSQEIRQQNRSNTTNPFLVHNEMGGVRSQPLTSGGGMTINQPHPDEEIYSGQLPAIGVQTTFNLDELPPPPDYKDLYFPPPPKYEDVV
ncbi:hypothetical protein AC249_AIPGENE13962 [Exaiptasia diaphana]|nr:hypothetical protein AC249_AIPGENE13962 [Exaiptasia diaphana]